MELERVVNGVYTDVTSGERFLLRSVDKVYKTKRKPKYYLTGEKGKTGYLSGLFPTKNDSIYSMDMRDSLGVKIIYDCTFIDSGKRLRIVKHRA